MITGETFTEIVGPQDARALNPIIKILNRGLNSRGSQWSDIRGGGLIRGWSSSSGKSAMQQYFERVAIGSTCEIVSHGVECCNNGVAT